MFMLHVFENVDYQKGCISCTHLEKFQLFRFSDAFLGFLYISVLHVNHLRCPIIMNLENMNSSNKFLSKIQVKMENKPQGDKPNETWVL